MSNKITFGLRNVHYALATFAEDTWTFDTPKDLIGAQEFSSELVGGTTQVYADDKIFHTLVSNSGATITLKLTELSDEFKKDIFGYALDSNNNLVEVVNADVKTFALGYEIQGDSKIVKLEESGISYAQLHQSDKPPNQRLTQLKLTVYL